MPNAGFITYAKTTAKEDAAITTIRAADVAAITERNVAHAAAGEPLEVIETNDQYTTRILTGVIADWVNQANALNADSGTSKLLIQAIRSGTLTNAQLQAMKTDAGL